MVFQNTSWDQGPVVSALGATEYLWITDAGGTERRIRVDDAAASLAGHVPLSRTVVEIALEDADDEIEFDPDWTGALVVVSAVAGAVTCVVGDATGEGALEFVLGVDTDFVCTTGALTFAAADGGDATFVTPDGFDPIALDSGRVTFTTIAEDTHLVSGHLTEEAE